MKKQEFLKALKGSTIIIKQVNPFNSVDDLERVPTFEISGLPEALSQMHTNQIVANLLAWCSDKKTEKDHDLSYYYTNLWLEQCEVENTTGLDYDSSDDVRGYADWCELHPTLIFTF